MNLGPERIASADLNVTIVASITKVCPVKDEIDTGSVTLAYRTHGQAIELHHLARFLGSFRNMNISHEDVTRQIAIYTGCHVETTWMTAGMEVRCAVLREPINAKGA
jgi:NADPH-dependent 7-cyano-7-deazaguanine reductase QueF